MLLKDDGFARALVTIRNQDLNRNIIGSRNVNPLIDTCIYEVQFQDGLIRKYAANLIAKTFTHRHILMVMSFLF